MSLAEFQRAFAAAVADPLAWAEKMDPDGPSAATGDPLLEPRERERLRRLLRHEGMCANRILLRAMRAMPLHSALPLTCDWLRSEMPAVLDEWISVACDASVQYGREADRFTAWLPDFLLRTGHKEHPALDALRYERAIAAQVREIEQGAFTRAIDLLFTYDPDQIIGGWRPGIRVLEMPLATRLCIRGTDLVLLR